MLRSVLAISKAVGSFPQKSASNLTESLLVQNNSPCMQFAFARRCMSSQKEETDAEFDARFEAYFNKADIDGWEVRKGMTDVMKYDLIPEPKIIVAALKACRRVNDYALTTRFLETVKDKCGPKANEIYPWIIQELRPTLDELGISTPEELGYDKPELALIKVDEID